MDLITVLSEVAERAPNSNMRSVASSLIQFGAAKGLNRPHRLAHFIAQVAHESARFRYDREIWGPTPAQRRYDIREDLGNTPQRDGDGYLLRGRGPIQTTGGHNYRAFSAWAKTVDPNAPDFFEDPDALNTDPWEGLSAIWYWDDGNPTGRSLNRYADHNNIELITKRINGGLNGYSDRLRLYDAAALVLLGRDPDAIRAFQRSSGLVVDGISGPVTRRAMHKALQALPSFPWGGSVEPAPATPTQPKMIWAELLPQAPDEAMLSEISRRFSAPS